MLYTSFLIGYSFICFFVALILNIKFRNNFINHFYTLLVLLIIIFGVIGYSLNLPLEKDVNDNLEKIIIFLYSLFPFFFMHFIVVYVGFIKMLKSKFLILMIYFTGFFSYTLTLLDLIPRPIDAGGGLSQTGSIFYITWMSILFTLGIAQLYSLVGGFNKKTFRSGMLFSGFMFLFIILPGPFSESVLGYFFGDNITWYFFTSFTALGIAVYFVFRHKASLTIYDALKSTYSIMRDIMIKTDENFQIETVKGSVFLLLGYEDKELIGRPISDILLIDQPILNGNEEDEEDFNYRKFMISNMIEKGLFDVDAIAKSGKLIPMNFSFSPVIDNEVITGYVGIGRDFTERKLIEQELIEAKRKAEHSDQLKSEFLAQVSHELRTPINIIVNFTGMLRDSTFERSPEEFDETVKIINDASDRLVRTMDLTLNMSEVQVGSYQFKSQKIDLHKDILENLFLKFKRDAKLKKIDFKLNNSTASSDIVGDEYSINQIFLHLIDNAIKFTEKGKVSINISNVDKKLIIEIIDTGIGIGESFYEDVFRPFRQEFQGYTRNFDGSGLGLALVKSYCEINKAEIDFESEKEVGSTFRVIFQKN